MPSKHLTVYSEVALITQAAKYRVRNSAYADLQGIAVVYEVCDLLSYLLAWGSGYFGVREAADSQRERMRLFGSDG